MTGDPKPDPSGPAPPRPSLLPFDPSDLVAMRVRPAKFAKMCEVSKQTVSGWIKRGIVTIGPDGMLDPAVASRQVFERTDPARLRARVFKSAMLGHDELLARVRSLEKELAEQREQHRWELRALDFRRSDETDRQLSALLAALLADFGSFAELHRAGRVDELTDRIDDFVGRFFYADPETDEMENVTDKLPNE